MTITTEQAKLDQYNEFFSIAHDFTVNIEPLVNNQVSSYQQFLDSIPAPFVMASEIATLDQAALKPLQALSGVAGQLIDYLNHQARKIDLMMTYIIQQQDCKESRYQGTSFGGGGFTFISEHTIDVDTRIEVKIFIPEENCAIYCFGEVISAINIDDDTKTLTEHKVIYHFIKDEDRDALVRASLHKQSKDLQALAEKRRQEKADN
ncbi:PilZ domain-containing protein [Thalassotalea sediminis]|uniref:PilZ domain-containing protein n=1 Tax=Thalassotalea sediminis TaxID=1759089 RepID=UPI0025735C77|nr:PilZ domain-containing protein [Thalassotalea sediminis]